jgi:hypothetical protein
MNKRIGAKAEMWRTVRDLKNNTSYAALIAGVPGIGAGFTTLEGYITQVEALDVSRGGAAAVAGPAKEVARGLLITTAAIVDGIFTARAAEMNDNLLLEQVNKERSDFRNMRDEGLRSHCQFLLGLIETPIPAALTDLGLTTTLATELQTRYDTFNTLMTLPQSKLAQESTFVTLIEQQEDQVDRLLDLRLDKLMRQFTESQPQFYTEYKEARVIMDAATQHRLPVPPIPPAPEPTPGP